MKTTVFLISQCNTPKSLTKKGTEQINKIRKRFLSEKIFSIYAHSDNVSKKAAEISFKKRGYEIKEHDSINNVKAPEEGRICIRKIIGLNIGKTFVIMATSSFINNVLKGLEFNKKVSKEGSITRLIYTWDQRFKVEEMDDTKHLNSS
ncbi:MAG: hypothetical protein ABIJ92_05155 [Candidatus Aenigmatarchaeota archaeon]